MPELPGGFPQWVIGVILGVAASAISNLGLTLQKRAHLDAEAAAAVEKSAIESANGHAPSEEPPGKHYSKRGIWQLGLGLVISGSLFDFAALAFAAQSVVTPLGALTLVSNVFFAPCLLKEHVSRFDLVCTLFILAGCTLCVVFAEHEDTAMTTSEMFGHFRDTRFVVYSAIITIIICSLAYANYRIDQLRNASPDNYVTVRRSHRFVLATLAGIMGAQSVLFAKCTSSMLVNSIKGETLMFAHAECYGILLGLFVTIYYQIKWLNGGLQLFTAVYMVPVFQSFWILTSVVSGMIFFGEYKAIVGHIANATLFPIGILLTITGVYYLSQRDPHHTGPPASSPSNVDQTPLLSGGADSAARLSRHQKARLSSSRLPLVLSLQDQDFSLNLPMSADQSAAGHRRRSQTFGGPHAAHSPVIAPHGPLSPVVTTYVGGTLITDELEPEADIAQHRPRSVSDVGRAIHGHGHHHVPFLPEDDISTVVFNTLPLGSLGVAAVSNIYHKLHDIIPLPGQGHGHHHASSASLSTSISAAGLVSPSAGGATAVKSPSAPVLPVSPGVSHRGRTESDWDDPDAPGNAVKMKSPVAEAKTSINGTSADDSV